jgi:hypothetical protein
MADDPQQTEDKKIPERPLDPTRDASDIMDPAGRIGVTAGDPKQISAEPDAGVIDETAIRGGVIDDPTKVNPTGIAPDSENDALYDKHAAAAMSSTRAAINDDAASEEERDVATTARVLKEIEDDDTPARGTAGAGPAPDPEDIPAEESGENTASGSATDPEVVPPDAGSLMAQYTGNDPDPDMDNPQELGIGGEVDTDEEAIKDS